MWVLANILNKWLQIFSYQQRTICTIRKKRRERDMKSRTEPAQKPAF